MPTVLFTEPCAFEHVAAVWPQLLARTRPRAPMLDLDWIAGWWRLHGSEGQPLLVLVTDGDGSPVGLAPLYRRNATRSPRDWLRTVHFLGTGEPERDELMGEYNTWLAAPEAMSEVTRAVASCLAERRASWDRVRLERLRPEARIHAELSDLLAPCLASAELDQLPTYRSRALGAVDDYVARLPSANFRHRCRRALRAARDLGVELVRAADAAERASMLAELRRLHQQRWSARGQPGVFASPVFTAFHEEWLARADEDHAWLVGLRHQQRFLAVRYYLRAGDTLYDYVSGVDTTAPAALAPGLALHLLTLDACQNAGVRVYDFMAGDQEYKRQLAYEHDVAITVDLFSRRLPCRLWLAARALRRAAKQRWVRRTNGAGLQQH